MPQPPASDGSEVPSSAASQPKSSREKALEASLFGTESFFVSKLAPEDAANETGSTPLFYIDNTRSEDVEQLLAHEAQTGASSSAPLSSYCSGVEGDEAGLQKAAWVDEDSEEKSVDISAVKRFKKLRQNASETVVSTADLEKRLKKHIQKNNRVPAWATYAGDAEAGSESADSILSSAAPFGILDKSSQKRSGEIPADKIDIGRLKNINVTYCIDAPVKSVEFHPNGNVLLAAGFKSRMALFSIRGPEEEGSKLQSVQFKDMPVEKAVFAAAGKEAICTGNKAHFYVYDLQHSAMQKIPKIRGVNEKAWRALKVSPSGALIAFVGGGAGGNVVLLSGSTKQMIGSFALNCAVVAVAFSPDERLLYCLGAENHTLYVWDLVFQRVVHSVVDNDGLFGTSVDVSCDGATVSCGFDSGIVNLYDASQPQSPTLRKTVDNLTTAIRQISFNHDSKLLGMCSADKKNQFKLLHAASNRVFANWPTIGTPLGFVNCFAFSPHHGYLSVGNSKGNILLYKLAHYNSA